MHFFESFQFSCLSGFTKLHDNKERRVINLLKQVMDSVSPITIQISTCCSQVILLHLGLNLLEKWKCRDSVFTIKSGSCPPSPTSSWIPCTKGPFRSRSFIINTSKALPLQIFQNLLCSVGFFYMDIDVSLIFRIWGFLPTAPYTTTKETEYGVW